MKAIIFVFYFNFVTISAVLDPKIPENRHWKDHFEKLDMKAPPSPRPDREHMLWKAVPLAYLERNNPKEAVENSHHGDYSGDEDWRTLGEEYQNEVELGIDDRIKQRLHQSLNEILASTSRRGFQRS
ncbi:hypothetical protein GCK72_009864 [Caenorhabditis remanei]|uniref:Uncharacterized protein n=1 Tax=Caenorhabditis remanei TaxID=31234 RepID=A0A6A5H1K9_CAERE|nr:hypothetical protein GCK72_009864 [Caenorhabditis remanei]KAF1761608.1 hypothetical protein GCK72_009864 [Caenorhabditis remanei]